jgi:hypothetical protein
MSTWFQLCAPWTYKKQYRRLVKVHKNNNNTDISMEVGNLINSCRALFVAYILTTIGKQANCQIFYITLVIRMRGLSRNGLDFLSSFGTTLSLRTFDVYFDAFLGRVREANR